MKECSGCAKKRPSVNRNMFDGLCADCTYKALYNYEFAKKAKERNKKSGRKYDNEDMFYIFLMYAGIIMFSITVVGLVMKYIF